MLPTKNRTMWYFLLPAALLGLGLAAVVVILATHVEDWSRDLTQNYAETSPSARDNRLAPLEAPAPPAELAAATERAVKSLPNWRLESRRDEAASIQLHCVRTTGIMRYQDDIHVAITPHAAGSRLSASSRSRVGKGDLGQNPRNLRELLAAVRKEIGGGS